MAVDLRQQIFELRQQGVSERGIAQQLGVSSSKVHRELNKRAPEVRAEREQVSGLDETPGWAPGVEVALPPLPPGADPLLVEETRRLQLDQLELRRLQLRAQRLEAERRAQLLEHPEAGGSGNGLVTLVLQVMERNREETRTLIAQLLQRQAPAQPAAQPPSMIEQLASYKQMAETMASFAPPAPPTAQSGLEYTVATERLKLESQDLAARRDAELEERRERARSEAGRNDAVAKAIEEFTPLAGKFVQHWFEERERMGRGPLQLPPAPGDEEYSTPPRPVVLPEPAAEVTGRCPSCQAELAMTGTSDERCPRCGSVLTVAEGRIRVRVPNGGLWPPLQTSAGVQN